MDLVLDLLIKARQLISEPARWTRSYWARDKDGQSCLAHDSRAVRWCSTGAISKVLDRSYSPCEWWAIIEPLNQASQKLFGLCIAAANDCLTHAQVMRIWDEAIRFAKERALLGKDGGNN